MFSLQSGIEFLAVAGTWIYAIGQIRATSEANRKGLDTLKLDLTNLLEKNNAAMHELLESFREYNKEALTREVVHLKDLMANSSRETREDIKRLEEAQRESNRMKSRLCMVEASVKSIHKRLDIEPNLPIGEDME